MILIIWTYPINFVGLYPPHLQNSIGASHNFDNKRHCDEPHKSEHYDDKNT